MNSNEGQNSQGTSQGEGKSPMVPVISKESGRYCWVCFASEEEDREAAWVQPCNCRGTTKWVCQVCQNFNQSQKCGYRIYSQDLTETNLWKSVHQTCLQRWVDEKQKGGNMGKVTCPQCQTEYIIVFPNMGVLVLILDSVDSFIYKGCPFMAAGIVVGAVYWCAVTYGAITVMQVIGQKEGLAIMEQADPLILLIGLPAIPVALLLGKLIRWEDAVLSFMRKNINKIPIIRSIPPFRIDIATSTRSESITENDLPPLTSPVSATRVLCGALLMPTISTFVGKFFFDSVVKSNFHRTLLGGLAFIAIKGCLKIYHKQQNYIRQCQRKILDYTEANISTYVRHNTRNAD